MIFSLIFTISSGCAEGCGMLLRDVHARLTRCTPRTNYIYNLGIFPAIPT